MTNYTPWQIDCAEGLFGICVPLLTSCTFITAHNHNEDHLQQPTYTSRLGEENQDNQPRRYHIQATTKHPNFYGEGCTEVVSFRGAPQKEEYIRHWLQAMTEYLLHQLDFPFEILVRTVSNKTPTFSNRSRQGEKSQWFSETIAKLLCQADNYKKGDDISNMVKKTFQTNWISPILQAYHAARLPLRGDSTL
jgi:hypothetical protein